MSITDETAEQVRSAIYVISGGDFDATLDEARGIANAAVKAVAAEIAQQPSAEPALVDAAREAVRALQDYIRYTGWGGAELKPLKQALAAYDKADGGGR